MTPHLAKEAWFFPAMIGVHVTLLTTWLSLLWVRYRADKPTDRSAWTVGAAAVVLWILIGPAPLYAHLPVDWFTPLQEGDGLRPWRLLGGQGLHIGPGYHGFWMRLVGASPAGPRAMLALNTWFGVLDVLLLGVAVLWMTGSRWASLLWIGLAMGTRPWIDASLSDQPATVTAFYLFPTITAGLSLPSPTGRSPTRIIATLCLIAATLGLASHRLELVALPLAALLGGWMGWWRRDREAWRPRPTRLVAAFAAWIGFSLVAVSHEIVAFPATPHLPLLRWVQMGLYPLNLSWVGACVLALACMPPGVLLLSILGGWRAVRAGGPALAGVVALVVLANAYYAAAHGGVIGDAMPVSPYELYRYGLLLFLPWMVLAGWGWRPAWQGTRRWLGDRGAAVALLAVCVCPPMPGLTHALPGQHALWTPVGPEPRLPRSPWVRIDRDTQRDYHLQVTPLLDGSTCVHIMRFLPWFGAAPGDAWWGVATPHPVTDGVRVHELPRDHRSAAQVASALWPEASCGRLHVGLDCATVPDLGCEDDVVGLTLLHEATWTHRPYVHPEHARAYRSTIHTAVYDLPLDLAGP